MQFQTCSCCHEFSDMVTFSPRQYHLCVLIACSVSIFPLRLQTKHCSYWGMSLLPQLISVASCNTSLRRIELWVICLHLRVNLKTEILSNKKHLPASMNKDWVTQELTGRWWVSQQVPGNHLDGRVDKEFQKQIWFSVTGWKQISLSSFLSRQSVSNVDYVSFSHIQFREMPAWADGEFSDPHLGNTWCLSEAIVHCFF